MNNLKAAGNISAVIFYLTFYIPFGILTPSEVKILNESTDNRQKIISTALELFAKKGYDAVSTVEIANAAGITKPTMYYYFGSKEGLLSEILNIHYNRFLLDLEKVATLPEDVSLTFFRLMRVYFDYALNNPDFILLKLGTFNRIGEDTSYICSKPYKERESSIITRVFEIAADHVGNIRGKEDMCTISFIGVAHATIAAYLHTGDEKLLSDDTIYRLRQQFLYGIYS